MLTYNNFVELFSNIANAHNQINDFGIGDITDIESTDNNLYTRFWVTPVDTTVLENVEQRTFNLLVFDLVGKDESNKHDVISDTEQILKDIIKILKVESPYYTCINEPTLELFTDRFGDDVTGWATTVTIESELNNGYCDVPSELFISPYTPIGSGGTYNNGSFNCDDLNDCSVILGLSQSIANINATFSNYLLLSGGTMSGLINYTGTAFGTYSLITKEYADSITPAAQSLYQTLLNDNSTGNLIITASANSSNILQVTDTVMGLSWNDAIGGNVTLDNSGTYVYSDANVYIESQTRVNVNGNFYVQSGTSSEIYLDSTSVYLTADQQTYTNIETNLIRNHFKHNIENLFESPNNYINGNLQVTNGTSSIYVLPTVAGYEYNGLIAGQVNSDDTHTFIQHDALVDIISQNVNVLAGTAISLNALGVKVTSTDNASLQIISPTGFYYPSLGFWNAGTNYLGAITGYAGSLYIAGAGAVVTPLLVNTVVQLPYLTAGSMLYVDSFNSIREVMLGTGLTFSGATLSTTSTIPVISSTTVITSATSSVINITTPNTYYSVTSLNSAITFTTIGSASNFDKMIVRVKDNGTAQSLTFDPTYFEAKGKALPTTTIAGKVITIGFIYDSVTAKQGCVSVAQEI